MGMMSFVLQGYQGMSPGLTGTARCPHVLSDRQQHGWRAGGRGDRVHHREQRPKLSACMTWRFMRDSS